MTDSAPSNAPAKPPVPPKADKKKDPGDDKKDGKRTVQDWAFRKGHNFGGRKPWEVKGFDAVHSAAVILHGWAQHEHDEQTPMRLSEADYDAALAAVTSVPLAAHEAAVSKYCKHGCKTAPAKKAGE